MMTEKHYEKPEAEVLIVMIESGMMSVYNPPMEEEDDDIFGNG